MFNKQSDFLPLIHRQPHPHTIRASEIGSFLYCRRAWWYERSGEKSANQAEMLSGIHLHQSHGRQVLTAGVFRLIGYILALSGLVLLTIYITNHFLP